VESRWRRRRRWEVLSMTSAGLTRAQTRIDLLDLRASYLLKVNQLVAPIALLA
jgi:hypothetical protein